MKTLAVCLAFALLSLAAHAQGYYYGAWWDTRVDRQDILTKRAGQMLFVFQNGGTLAVSRSLSLTNINEYAGTWHINARSGKVTFTATNSSGQTRLVGTGNANSIEGVILGRDFRARCRGSRQALPTP